MIMKEYIKNNNGYEEWKEYYEDDICGDITEE